MATFRRISPGPGRKRVRKPDSRPDQSRTAAAKRINQLAGPDGVPAFIRAEGLGIDKDDREYLRRKLGRRLGKFARSLERVSVRLRDLNGPRGGIDTSCQIKVTLRSLPSVVVESRSAVVRDAMDDALARMDYAVRQSLKCRQTRPHKRRRGRHSAESGQH